MSKKRRAGSGRRARERHGAVDPAGPPRPGGRAAWRVDARRAARRGDRSSWPGAGLAVVATLAFVLLSQGSAPPSGPRPSDLRAPRGGDAISCERQTGHERSSRDRQSRRDRVPVDRGRLMRPVRAGDLPRPCPSQHPGRRRPAGDPARRRPALDLPVLAPHPPAPRRDPRRGAGRDRLHARPVLRRLGQALDATQSATRSFGPGSKLWLFVDRKPITGDPRAIPLTNLAAIEIQIGPAALEPLPYTFPADFG